MFSKIKELCRMISGVDEERIVEEKITKHLVCVRREAKIDTTKLENAGFVVIEGDSITEGIDFNVAKSTIVSITKYNYNEGETNGEN